MVVKDHQAWVEYEGRPAHNAYFCVGEHSKLIAHSHMTARAQNLSMYKRSPWRRH